MGYGCILVPVSLVKIVWDKRGGRTYLPQACASTSTAVVHQEVIRTECFCEPSPGGITVPWGTR